MKTHIINLFLILAIALNFSSCKNDWEDVPGPIASFLSEYFPLQGVSDYGYNGTVYHVKLRNSVAVSFDNNYKWMSINGYGNTLPTTLLFDQFPPALYEYLQEREELSDVYSVSRDNISYIVTLLDSTLVYNIKLATTSIVNSAISRT